MISTINNASSHADTVAAGNYNAKIVPRSDKDILGISLQKMTENLKELNESRKKYNWTEQGFSELNRIFRNEQK